MCHQLPQNGSKTKAALRYCGSCNPHFDLEKTGHSLVEAIARLPGFTLVPLSTDNIDLVIILCGCPRACGNKEEIRAIGKHHLLINGDSPRDTSALEASLLTIVTERHKSLT